MKKFTTKVCINKCKYDDFDLCVGCYRTKKEIVDWFDYTDEQKFEVLDKIEIRKQPGKKYSI